MGTTYVRSAMRSLPLFVVFVRIVAVAREVYGAATGASAPSRSAAARALVQTAPALFAARVVQEGEPVIPDPLS